MSKALETIPFNPPARKKCGVRPFTADDAPAAAELYRRNISIANPARSPPLADRFRAMFCDSPWLDPEIPSLVYDDGAGIAGFLGAYVRPMKFDGRMIRVACSGQLVASPEARHTAAGAFLMQRFLAGPQDLSITDGATPLVRKLWERLGGQTALLHCLRWTTLLRPAQFAGDYLARRKALRPLAALSKPLLKMTDAAARLAVRPNRRSTDELFEEKLTAPSMNAAFGELSLRRRLVPAYDEPYLAWLLSQLREAADARGALVARLVKSGDGAVLGWYVYFLTPQRIAEVVQLAAGDAPDHERFANVLDCLLADAERRGAVAVQGRVESGLLENLSERRAWLHFRAPLALVHSRNAEILSAIHAGQSFLTRADGEWWTTFHF
jgi:hypothetical protein